MNLYQVNYYRFDGMKGVTKMGRDVPTRTSYKAAVDTHIGNNGGSSTRRGAEEVRKTGKLNPLVDPAGFGVIRRSLLRFEPLPNGLFVVTVGTPIEKEDRLDTTGSMENNVEIAIQVLPDSYELCSALLPGYDLQMAIGIFGDCDDKFVLCRPQFEMTSEKLVEQLTLMVPEGQGWGNGGEDPHYGLFGGAYLTASYSNRIGLKGYDFTTSDEPARYDFDAHQLKRVFGDQVFEKTAENGFKLDAKNLPSTKEAVQDLLKRSHAFFLQVGDGSRYNCHDFWSDIFGQERVIALPKVELLPQVQAVIIGLTESTLGMCDVMDYLAENKVNKMDAKLIARSVANIPIGAQAVLRRAIEMQHPIPKKGDIFRNKTDLWPMTPEEIEAYEAGNTTEPTEPIKWL